MDARGAETAIGRVVYSLLALLETPEDIVGKCF